MWDLWWTMWHWMVGFLRVLRFPLPILIPSNASLLPSEVDTIDQIVADVPCGFSLTTDPKKLKKR
jgi:hypothetical protein